MEIFSLDSRATRDGPPWRLTDIGYINLHGFSASRESSRAGTSYVTPEAMSTPTLNANAVQIVVCIPTFRRSGELRKSLVALQTQTISECFAVLIINNDPQDSLVHEIVAGLGGEIRITVLDLAVRGVSAVRNFALQQGMQIYPCAEWMAFQDDDEIAMPGWLAGLVDAGHVYNADLVGSWNTVHTPNGFRHAYLFNDDRRHWRSGPTNRLKGTNSLLISVDYLHRLDRQPFRLEFGSTGGEDYEFFRDALRRGARLAWTNEADIIETWPEERHRFSSLLHRRIRVGAYEAVIDGEYDGLAASVSKTLHGLFIGAPKGVVKSFLLNPNPLRFFVSGVYAEAYFVGRIFGHLRGAVRHYA